MLSPCLSNKIGIGTIASARNASREFPHPSPSAWYNLGAASGSTAAMIDRTTVLAASAEAA